MFGARSLRIFPAVAIVIAACGDGRRSSAGRATQRYGLGRAAATDRAAALAIDVDPSGAGLPPGSGRAAQGAVIFAQKCARCHGSSGEGLPPASPAIVGRDPVNEHFNFSLDWKAPRTIGNYWPYATTLFDYLRRAMPLDAPGSLSNDDVYALTAWLLAANLVIAPDATLDATALAAVKMPYASRFVPDNRRGGREVR